MQAAPLRGATRASVLKTCNHGCFPVSLLPRPPPLPLTLQRRHRLLCHRLRRLLRRGGHARRGLGRPADAVLVDGLHHGEGGQRAVARPHHHHRQLAHKGHPPAGEGRQPGRRRRSGKGAPGGSGLGRQRVARWPAASQPLSKVQRWGGWQPGAAFPQPPASSLHKTKQGCIHLAGSPDRPAKPYQRRALTSRRTAPFRSHPATPPPPGCRPQSAPQRCRARRTPACRGGRGRAGAVLVGSCRAGLRAPPWAVAGEAAGRRCIVPRPAGMTRRFIALHCSHTCSPDRAAVPLPAPLPSPPHFLLLSM